MGRRDSLILTCDSFFAGMLNLKAGRYQIPKKLLKQNRELQAKGRDREICFVLGNGPSLKNVNLDLRAPYLCFTKNLFYTNAVRYKNV